MITELFIENNKVDIEQDVIIPVTFTVADIRDISKRRTNFSKTIKVPGTKNNNKLFGHAYDIQADVSPSGANAGNIDVNFNQKKKADFLLLADGASVLNGTAELKSVDITNGEIVYDIVLFGEFTNIMSELGDKKLSDLDLSSLTHDYTKENVTGSWDGGTDYVYPLIDYGVVRSKANVFTVNSLRPAVYVKHYWDEIFSQSNFEYESEFIESELFTQLIIPYNRKGIDADRASSDELNVFQSQEFETDFDQELNFLRFNSYTAFGRVFDTVLVDTSGGWDTGSLAYTASVSERLDINVNMVYVNEYEIEVDLGGLPDDPIISKAGYTASMKLTHLSSSGAVKNEYEDFAIIEDEDFNYLSPGTALTDNVGFNIFADVSLEAGDKFYIELDNKVADFDIFSATDYPMTGSVTASVQSGSNSLQAFGSSVEGGEITQDDFVPTDISQRDFILNILRLFNLYLYEDDKQPRKVIVKPRDDFYAGFETLDWTDKLDLDRTTRIEPVPIAKAKTLVYKYKHDPEDFYLSDYKSNYDKNYGEKRLDTGYDFSAEEKDVLNLEFGTACSVQYTNEKALGDYNIEISKSDASVAYITSFSDVTNAGDANLQYQDPDDDFPRFKRMFIGRQVEILNNTYEVTEVISPWSFRVSGSIDTSGYTGTPYDGGLDAANVPFFYVDKQNKVIPAIYKSEDGGVTLEQYASVPRILRYSKNIPLTGESWRLQDTPVEITIIKTNDYQSFTETNYEYRTETSSIEINRYPFVSHVDDPKIPNFDLLFEKPEEVYWNIILD